MSELRVFVRIGASERMTLELRPGEPVGPLSVGRKGDWAIEAPEIGSRHVFLYFDGEELHVSNARPKGPGFLNGEPIPERWVPIEPPAHLALGAARLEVLAFGGDASEGATQIVAPPPVPPARPKPERPRYEERPDVAPVRDDDEATRFAPVVPTDAPSLEVAVPPAPKRPPSAEPLPKLVISEHPPAPAPLVPAAADSAGGRSRARAHAAKVVALARRSWSEASLPQRAILVLLPFAIAATFVVFADEPPSRGGRRSAPSASALVSAAPPPAPSAAAPAQTAAPVVAAPERGPTTVPAGDKRSAERLAADAVAAGAFADAAQRYERLAAEHPDQPAFGEAARILRAKLSGAGK